MADLLVRAGRRALERLAYEDAAERFERALEALELADAEDEAGPVLLARGDALLRAGEPARRARRLLRGRAARAAGAATRRCWPRPRSASPASAIAIVDLDAEAIARLEEALERAAGAPVLRSRLQARLAVELYYAPDRTRSEALSAEAVATARGVGRPERARRRAQRPPRRAVAPGPHRGAARGRRRHDRRGPRRRASRHSELQARNWRVMDLFELGDMPACREEIARHARLADELRLPSFQWYTPLWAATEAVLAGRFAEAERLRRRGARSGRARRRPQRRAVPGMVASCAARSALEFERADIAFLQDKVANSPAGPAYRSLLVWVARRPRPRRARRARTWTTWMRATLAFDANWLSAQAEAAEAIAPARRPDPRRSVLYDRLAPYAGRRRPRAAR